MPYCRKISSSCISFFCHFTMNESSCKTMISFNEKTSRLTRFPIVQPISGNQCQDFSGASPTGCHIRDNTSDVAEQLRGRRAQNYAVRTQITKTTQVGQMLFGCASFCVIGFIWKERSGKRTILREFETSRRLDSLQNSPNRCICHEIRNVVDDQYFVDSVFRCIF